MVHQDIIDAISRERNFQDQKWGYNPHSVAEWLLIMEKELREAKDAWIGAPGDMEAMKELLQVVSVGVAAMEQHGVFERLPATMMMAYNDDAPEVGT